MRMMIKTFAVAAAFAMVAGSATAGDLTASIEATTDRVERGFTRTDGGPGYSLSARYDVQNGWYVGGRAATVDLFGADQQYDAYVGYGREIAGFAVSGELSSQNYVGAFENMNTVEATVRAVREFGPLTTTAAVSYSPDYLNQFGEATWVEVGAAYPLTTALTVSGGVGYQYIDLDKASYTTYNVGATYKVTEKVGVDVRYANSDHDFAPFGDSVSVSLKLAL